MYLDNFIPYFDMQEQIDTLPRKNVEGQPGTLCAEIARKTVEVSINPAVNRWPCTRSGWLSAG